MDIDTLLAREEIKDVLYRYARGIDRRDWDLLRSCYHDDAYDDHGSLTGQIDEFIRVSKPFAARVAETMHFLGNVLIELDGDRARVESYVVAYHRIESSDAEGNDAGGKDDIWGIRYVDRFEKRDDEWRIAYRVVAHEWRQVLPVPAGRGRGTVVGHWGSHGEDDPLHWIMTASAP